MCLLCKSANGQRIERDPLLTLTVSLLMMRTGSELVESGRPTK